MSTFELQSRSNIVRTLGPVLAFALLTTLAACTPPRNGGVGDDESSSSAMMESSSAPVMESSSIPVMESSSAASETTMESSSQAMAVSSKPVVQAHVYTDGTYSAQGAYRSPAGGELVNVSLTLQGDVVTNATFSGTATNPKSKMMQAAFASGFKTQVVGKSLDQVNVGVVNGSSLTGIGFMDAVARIKAQAKS